MTTKATLSTVLLALLALAAPASAGIPQAISVQGVLRDGAGKLQSTPVNVQVSFFDAQTAGNPLSMEPLAMNVMAVNGLFSVTINDAALAGKLYGSATGEVWLELSVGNDTYPRQQVTSNVFALYCAQADTAKNALAIGGAAVSSSPAPTANQVLTYSATKGWTPGSQAGATTTSTFANSGAGFIGATGTVVGSTAITPPGPGRIVVTVGSGQTLTFHNTNTQDSWWCCIATGTTCLSTKTTYSIGASVPGNGTSDVMGYPLSLAYAYDYTGAGGAAVTFNLFCGVNTAAGGVAVRDIGMFATFFPNAY